MNVGDWVIAKTNRGNVEGTIHKLNPKRFIVRLRRAGKDKYITRRYRDFIEVVDFYS